MIIEIKKYNKYSYLASILMLILAIFLIVKPLQSISTIITTFGVILIIEGILNLLSYFKLEKEYRVMSFSVVMGITNILFGIMAIILSDTLISFFPIIISIWIILKSIVNFQISLNLKSINASSWLFTMVTSVITFILGIIILINPFQSAALAIRIIGIVLAITEIDNVVENIATWSKNK